MPGKDERARIKFPNRHVLLLHKFLRLNAIVAAKDDELKLN